MVNRIGAVNPSGLNVGFSSRFCVGSQVQHETPEEGQRIYWLKHCQCNNKDEINLLNILSDKNYLRLYNGKIRLLTLVWIDPERVDML